MKKILVIALLSVFIGSCAADPTTAINQFVKTHFPEATVLYMQRDGGEYEVRLNDNTELEFNRKGEWKKIDCEHSTVYFNVPDAIVPQEILNYVKSNFPDNGITKIDKDYSNWEIELDNHLEVKFNKRFNVIEFD